MLSPPLSYRRNVPFHTRKSEVDFRADPYEDYEAMVVRQLTLHYGDLASYFENHPWHALINWLLQAGDLSHGPIVEVGSGSGRLSGALALHYPDLDVYGFDYSYQLLRVATDYWLESKQLAWQFPRGYAQPFSVPARSKMNNLYFGLSRAEQLPLANNSVGAVISSFLLDRLPDPLVAQAEWHRILRPGGYLVLSSPLNFQQTAHWQAFHPFEKWLAHCREAGWKLIEHPPKLPLREPLDQQGNAVLWQCERLVLQKQ